MCGTPADQWRLAAEAIIYTIAQGAEQKRSGGLQKLFILTVRGQRIKIHRSYHSSFEQWYPNEAPLIKLLLKILYKNDILKILNPQAALQKHPINTLESSKHPLNLVRLSL
jgi:hypothetical protein